MIDTNTCLFRSSHTTFGFVAKMRLHGGKSPTPAGIAVNACRNFASVVSNSLNGIPPLPHTAALIHPCNVVGSFSCLASSSHNVLATLSKLNPRIVFNAAYCPSFLSNFFSKIGLLLSSWPGGETSWMPSIIVFALCQRCSWEVGMMRLTKSST